MNNIIISQIVGLLAVSVLICSFQFKKKTTMMKLMLIANVLYFTQYFLLNAFSAMLTSLITIIRILLFNKYDKKRKAIPIKLVAFVLSLCVIAAIFTYNGFLSLIPIVITMIYTVTSTYKKPEKFKLAYFFCTIIWIFYNYSIMAYTALIGNFFEMASSFIGAKRKYKK